MVAKKLKALSEDFSGDAAVYEMDPPFEGHKFVVVSGVRNAFAHETMLFKSDKNGKVTEWGDLHCVRNTQSHQEVLGELGYTIEH